MSDAPLVRVEEPGRTPLMVVLGEPLEVGRESSGLLVDDAQVSRRHLLLRPNGAGVIVSDLGSTHGTEVDGIRIDGDTEAGPGSVITLGRTTITVVGQKSVPLPSPPDVSSLTSIEQVAGEVSKEAGQLGPQMMAERTLTIVFTDIESSTEISAEIGDVRWYDVLTDHTTMVRETATSHGGHIVKSVGDGFMITFGSARTAAHAAIAVQRTTTATSTPFRIRIGMHTGEAVVGDDGDLFGRHVNMAARVANTAHGDEILVSSITREIVESMGDLRFGEPRTVELKGLAGSHQVHPLLWAD